MPITAKCTIEHGTIKLPQSLSLPDGMTVLVSIEPLPNIVHRKKAARELAGTWKMDTSIDKVFSEIDAQRHVYFGRDVDI
jgi:hypothetical protein